MTNAELRAYEAIPRIAHALESKKEIDWEQRRYEIAKDMYTATTFYGNNGSPCGWMAENSINLKEMAEYAIRYADALINQLKNN